MNIHLFTPWGIHNSWQEWKSFISRWEWNTLKSLSALLTVNITENNQQPQDKVKTIKCKFNERGGLSAFVTDMTLNLNSYSRTGHARNEAQIKACRGFRWNIHTCGVAWGRTGYLIIQQCLQMRCYEGGLGTNWKHRTTTHKYDENTGGWFHWKVNEMQCVWDMIYLYNLTGHIMLLCKYA